MLGLKRGTVELCPHDTEWDKSAEEVITLLKSLMGGEAVGVRHIGSTAVPAIYAKPIIDIAVGVCDLSNVNKYIEVLNGHGIVLRREDIPGQLLFVMGDFEQDTRTHHIHFVNWNSSQWNDYIDFCDYLNAFTGKAKLYETCKMKLALQFPDNRNSYTEGKQELIKSLLAEARLWRANL